MTGLQRALMATSILALVTQSSAETIVSGRIGTHTWNLGGTPYRVVDTLTVSSGNTLTIRSGVDVVFDANVPIIIEGSLEVHGTVTDSVRFMPGAASEWGGIRIVGGGDNILSYTRVSGGSAEGLWELYCNSGGGIHCSGPNVRLTMHNSVVGRSRGTFGGGIYAREATLRLLDCTILENSGRYGGGVACHSSDVGLTRCDIRGNDAFEGLGVYAYESVVRLSQCTICANASVASGANAEPSGGAVHIAESAAMLEGCTIAGNTSDHMGVGGKGVLNRNSTTTLTNCIVWGNESPQQIRHEGTGYVTAAYSCVEGWYAGAEVIDSDPLFTDAANGDFSLQAASPCIDAGDASILDPDGSRSDMGAVWHGQPADSAAAPWFNFLLFPNQPNPFNPVTTITYSVAEAGPVTLSVYNLQGQLVKTLVEGIVQPGEYTTVWDGRDVARRHAASGVYLCRLVTSKGVRTIRMTRMQ